MDRVGSLLLAVLLITASSCTVQGEVTRHYKHYYEKAAQADTQVFRPLHTEKVARKGLGWVQHNVITDNTTGGSEVGSSGGMYFYHTKTAMEKIVTIKFSKNLDGIWSGSSLNVRGLWNMKPDGIYSLENQELAIVGGQGELRGASGSVYYKKLQMTPNTKWLVTYEVLIDESKNRMRMTQEDLDTLYKNLNLTESVHVSPETTESDDVLKLNVESLCTDPPFLRA